MTCGERACEGRTWTAGRFTEASAEQGPPAPAGTTQWIGAWQVEYSSLVRTGDRRLRRRSACVGLRPTFLDLLGVVLLVTLGVEVLLVIVGFLAAVVFAVAVDGGLESAEERLLVVGRHLGEGLGAVGEGSTPRRPTKKRLHSRMEPE